MIIWRRWCCACTTKKKSLNRNRATSYQTQIKYFTHIYTTTNLIDLHIIVPLNIRWKEKPDIDVHTWHYIEFFIVINFIQCIIIIIILVETFFTGVGWIYLCNVYAKCESTHLHIAKALTPKNFVIRSLFSRIQTDRQTTLLNVKLHFYSFYLTKNHPFGHNLAITPSSSIFNKFNETIEPSFLCNFVVAGDGGDDNGDGGGGDDDDKCFFLFFSYLTLVSWLNFLFYVCRLSMMKYTNKNRIMKSLCLT